MVHEMQDRASLEMAKRIAEGLPAHPEWIELARENLDRWSRLNRKAPGLLAVGGMQKMMVERWRDLIAAAQETGEIAAGVDGALWAQWIVHTFVGLVLARKLGTLRAAPHDVVAELKKLLFSAPPSRPRRRRTAPAAN